MRRNPKYSGFLWSSKNHPGNKPKHFLGVAPCLDASRKCALKLAGNPLKHLPEDFLLACELVVERPARHAGRLGELVHAHRSEPALKE